MSTPVNSLTLSLSSSHDPVPLPSCAMINYPTPRSPACIPHSLPESLSIAQGYRHSAMTLTTPLHSSHESRTTQTCCTASSGDNPVLDTLDNSNTELDYTAFEATIHQHTPSPHPMPESQHWQGDSPPSAALASIAILHPSDDAHPTHTAYHTQDHNAELSDGLDANCTPPSIASVDTPEALWLSTTDAPNAVPCTVPRVVLLSIVPVLRPLLLDATEAMPFFFIPLTDPCIQRRCWNAGDLRNPCHILQFMHKPKD